LSITAKHNRTSALLVALLYVFFSTFGAVAHTHVSVDGGRTGPAYAGAVANHLTPDAHRLGPAQPDCAACEWQALSVTKTNVPQPQIQSALLHMVPAVRTFSVYTVCLARFSSRAPPTA
jgi:hypothetical protein